MGLAKTPILEHTDIDRDLAAVRAQLGTAKYESIFVEGRAMSAEQAVTYALREDSHPFTSQSESAVSKGQRLVDPLSERELKYFNLSLRASPMPRSLKSCSSPSERSRCIRATSMANLA